MSESAAHDTIREEPDLSAAADMGQYVTYRRGRRGDPRSWASPAIPVPKAMLEERVSDTDREMAAWESAGRPMGYYVGEAARRQFAEPSPQVAATGRMALEVVQAQAEA